MNHFSVIAVRSIGVQTVRLNGMLSSCIGHLKTGVNTNAHYYNNMMLTARRIAYKKKKQPYS